jgi:hypothetical protein
MTTTEFCGSELAVYMGSDGAICHAPCWQPLQLCRWSAAGMWGPPGAAAPPAPAADHLAPL